MYYKKKTKWFRPGFGLDRCRLYTVVNFRFRTFFVLLVYYYRLMITEHGVTNYTSTGLVAVVFDGGVATPLRGRKRTVNRYQNLAT